MRPGRRLQARAMKGGENMNLQQMITASKAVDLVEIENGQPVTTSLKVAEYFGKEHKNVTRDIRDKILPYVSENFNALNFELVSYTDAKGEERPMYILTRDGFTMVAMGYTGAKAMKFKEDYITAFNRMEDALRKERPNNDDLIEQAATRLATKLFPQFVKTITPTLAKSIVDQVRSLPQGETLLPPPVVQPAEPQKTTEKRGKRIMKYTLHTWEIELTANGPVAKNKVAFETTEHSALMAKLKAIVGTGIQYVVNRERVSTAR